ncbi:hypothetical protein NO2_0882 [Candidatus Termititenax persephonae]|uniref:Uncharacterized protein n=1 Tax=Candidatus Termititenax persephonae TaxID=2218525 RepID=A0A388THU7_9BACT|nr:hypothetical protein NO2_0882 [Candidatus Termititenax persephonae]
MRNLKICLTGVIAVWALTGCGTTIKEALGDAPPNPDSAPSLEVTNRPINAYGWINVSVTDNVALIVGEPGSVENNSWVGIYRNEEILGETAAAKDGSFRVTASVTDEDEALAARAQAPQKSLSAPVSVSLKPLF